MKIRTWNEIIEDKGFAPQYLTITIKLPHVQGEVNISGLLIEERFDLTTVPSNWHIYALRHADNDWVEPISIERGVYCNFLGYWLIDRELPIDNTNDFIEVCDYNYRDWQDVAEETLEAYSLLDYLDYWENCMPISENVNKILLMAKEAKSN